MPVPPDERNDPSRAASHDVSRRGAPHHPIDDLRDGTVPPWLQTAASVGWRLLVVAAVVVGAAIAIDRLSVVVIPLLLAVLIAAVFAPPARWLRERGLPGVLATWIVLFAGAAVAVTLGWILLPRLADGFAGVGDGLADAYDELRRWLVEGPFGLDAATVSEVESRVVEQLRAFAEDGLAARATLAIELVTAFFLTLVVSFFYIKDGPRFHQRMLSFLPERDRGRADRAARKGWWVVQRYLLGVLVVGVVDAALIGVGLAVIGVPHVVPVMVLTFFGAFFPLVGALFAGAVATLLALASGGLGDALLVVVLTVAVQQFDGDVIAPVVYSRAIELHPLAVLLALTVGSILAGIIGALLAVPVLAVALAATTEWREGAHLD